MAFNKIIIVAILCILEANLLVASPTHVHELVGKKVEFIKDTFEHGKQGVYHLKDKTVDVVESGVEKVKDLAAAGVGAVKTAGSAVAGAVVAPFHKVGQVLHKKIDYIANKVLPAHDTEQHVEHGLAPVEETHVWVKDPVPNVHAEEHKLTVVKDKFVAGDSFSLFKKIKNGLSTLPIINHLVGENSVADVPVYVYVSSLENTPYHEIQPIQFEAAQELEPVYVKKTTTTTTTTPSTSSPINSYKSEGLKEDKTIEEQQTLKTNADGSYSLQQTF